MATKLDLRQSVYRGLLARISNTTNPEGDNLMEGINSELTPLLQLTVTGTNRVVSVGASALANPETGYNRALATIGANSPLLTSGTITFPATPGTVTVSPGNNATFSMGANEYIKALIYLDASNNLNLIFGTANAVEANATVNAPPEGTIGIGFVTIQTVGGNVQNILKTKIYQYAGAGGGTGSSGSGILSPAPGYRMLTAESFQSIQGSSDDTTNTAITKASYDAGKKMYQLSLDKSKTVATSSGTSLTINSAPTFTVQVGDIVYMTSGARINQWRRITDVGSQTSFTLDAAFSGGDAAAADTLMVSQAVWTVDLVNFGSATELNRPRDFYPNTAVLQILTDYADSLTSGDDIGDFVSTARVVMSACNSGLQAATGHPNSDLFTQAIYARPTAPNIINEYILQTNADQERLFLVFFPNPTNGSVTATCNLLEFECNYYVEPESVNGGVLNSAYGTSDNTSTAYNCTISTPSTQTQVDLNFSFYSAADPGGIGSQLQVFVDGQVVPKFVSSGVTPSTQLSYTLSVDANGLPRRIIFNTNLSIATKDIQVYRQFGVYDASFQQSAKLNGLYDAIVGSAAQVTAGVATHSTLQDAHDAVASGSRILILNGVTITGATVITKRLKIEGKGGGSVLTGNFTVGSGAAGSIFESFKVVGNIVFQSGADRCWMIQCYQNTAGTFTPPPTPADPTDMSKFDIFTE